MVLALAAACSAEVRVGERAATGDTSRAEAAQPASGERRIVFVGTSLTAGQGLEPEEAFPALIGNRIDSLDLNYEVINAGVSGETSAGTLRRMDWVLRDPLDVLVLETGANDGLRGLSVDSLRGNLQAILDKVQSAYPEAAVLLVGMEAPPNLGPRYTSAFRAVFPEVAGEKGVRYMPFLLDGVAAVRALNQGDGIHPNAEGARRVADNVWKALGPVLDSLDAAAQKP
jgi:acyl-CoA thioesterase-1